MFASYRYRTDPRRGLGLALAARTTSGSRRDTQPTTNPLPDTSFPAQLNAPRQTVGPTNPFNTPSSLPDIQSGPQFGQRGLSDSLQFTINDGRIQNGTSLNQFSKGQITDFNRLGYDYVERQALDAGRPRSLSDLVSGMKKYDNASALDANRALASTTRGISARTGVVSDPGDPLRRRTALARTALTVQNRNLGLRGELERQELAQKAGVNYSQQFDSAASDVYGTLAGTEAARKIMNANLQAGGGSDTLGTIGTLVGIGGTIASMASSRSLKHDKASVSILDKLATVPVEQWRYIEGGQELHIGPYAEDFNAAFGLPDKPYIQLIDYMGVLLGAVKELNDKVDRVLRQ